MLTKGKDIASPYCPLVVFTNVLMSLLVISEEQNANTGNWQKKNIRLGDYIGQTAALPEETNTKA